MLFLACAIWRVTLLCNSLKKSIQTAEACLYTEAPRKVCAQQLPEENIELHAQTHGVYDAVYDTGKLVEV